MRWCEAVEKQVIEELEREEHASVFMPSLKEGCTNLPSQNHKADLSSTNPGESSQARLFEKNQFLADVQLMFDNCRTFNRGTASNYLVEWADEMQQAFNNLMEKNASELAGCRW